MHPVNHKWVLTFVKGFFCIFWDYHVAFIFQFVNIMYHIDWFEYIEETFFPGINPTWSWCMSFLICSWILLAKILLRILICVHQWCWLGVFFFVCCLSLVLVSGWWWPHKNEFGSVPSSAIFWKSFRRIGISSSLNVC